MPSLTDSDIECLHLVRHNQSLKMTVKNYIFFNMKAGIPGAISVCQLSSCCGRLGAVLTWSTSGLLFEYSVKSGDTGKA